MLWLERYERLVVAQAATVEDSDGFYEARMQAFERSLDFDPDNNEQTRAARRDAELMEEVA